MMMMMMMTTLLTNISLHLFATIKHQHMKALMSHVNSYK